MMQGNWWSYIRYDEENDRPQLNRALLRRVARYGRPYLGQIVIMLFTILAISALGIVPPLLFRDLIDHALPERDWGRLNLLALGMIAIPVLTGLIGVVQRYMSSNIGEGIIFDLRCALFDHLQRMSLRFFTNTKTGELMSRLNNDVVGAQNAINSTIVTIISNIVALVATLAIMISLEWRLTLISIVILPLFILPARRVGAILRRLTRESMTNNAKMNALMNETLNVSGALLVKIFGRAGDEQARFVRRASRVRDVGVQQALVGRWFFLSLSLVSAVGTALVFWLGGSLVLSGVFTVGTIVAFGTYVVQIYGPLMQLTNARVEFATSLVSFERVFEVLDLPLEITDRPSAIDVQNVRGHVQFENVWFRYAEADGEYLPSLKEVTRFRWSSLDDVPLSTPKPRQNAESHNGEKATPAISERWALQHVSFEIQPGQLVALVGPSGAGKTSLTYLLPRLYDPTRGRITLDGRDLREVTLTSLAQHIGMVTQETYLFHDTIRANLLYAKPDATQGELEAACKAAHIYDFIVNLPDGFETIAGERGYRLSGGEKQRVAIARVLLKDPRVLILDEATSHLDSQSEALIQDALERAMSGRTSLVIAHRLSTILKADRILVMNHGQLVEQGTHSELLSLGGLYATLYQTQFRERRPAALPDPV